MTKAYTLQEFYQYLADVNDQVNAACKELEEVQLRFTSTHVEWKARHDASLEQLSISLVERIQELGPELTAQIQEQAAQEAELVEKRRQQLRSELIPVLRIQADQLHAEGQKLKAKQLQRTPELDEREESLKKGRERLEQELASDNEQIKQLSRGLGVMTHFIKISQVDKHRQRTIGKLEGLQTEIRKVRETWATETKLNQEEEQRLQTEWSANVLEQAQLNAELSYLDDSISREALILKRAIRYLLDNLKEPIECPIPEVKSKLDAMVQLNIQTDIYMEALGTVSGLIGTGRGVSEGLARFSESVKGLLDEQEMHSAHLPKLTVALPDSVLQFNGQWRELAKMFADEGKTSADPVAFTAAVKPRIDHSLSMGAISKMFEEMGAALKIATRAWK